MRSLRWRYGSRRAPRACYESWASWLWLTTGGVLMWVLWILISRRVIINQLSTANFVSWQSQKENGHISSATNPQIARISCVRDERMRQVSGVRFQWRAALLRRNSRMKSREILRILIIKMEENRRNLKVKFLDIELKKRKSFRISARWTKKPC